MKKILVVDDDPVFPLTLSDSLPEEKYDVTICTDGESGLEKLRELKPDLVLLDMLMPKMTGPQVLKEVRKDESLKHIPIVIISNLDGMDEIGGSVALGASGYFIKSESNLDTIVEAVEKVIEENG